MIFAIPAGGLCFNPRTHKGATKALADVLAQLHVSIHAPIRVRRPILKMWESESVSIHAPIRVRQHHPDAIYLDCSFNPRTHKGATQDPSLPSRHPTCFNPRTHKGATFLVAGMPKPQDVSIHAPIRVRRLAVSQQLVADGCFNPRTHKGATGRSCLCHRHPHVSIHAPIRVRLGTRSGIPVGFSFNPRTHKGATCR